MPRMIFISLPVTNVARSRKFYEALGFTINEKFSSATSACVVVSDAIYFMIQTQESFQNFSPKPLVLPSEGATSLIALSCDSRAHVDELVKKAVAAGGSTPLASHDHGSMYQHGFQDLDGHLWELFWMETSHAA